ncbi:MAG: lipopolysaccharide biosynthesis protein RfbH [Eubacteriales bacterium]|nr:lipopolysaccharide biosynthesis protein RfbH [Eubacteriales bacterium]
MFKNLSEKEAHELILQLVGKYCDTYHNQDKGKPYVPGSRIPYAARVYDREEMMNLVDSSLEFWLTMGRYTNEFEAGLARFIGVPFADVVNSGSSANLLAFMALTAHQLGDRAIKRGDEIITVAAGFPTTVTPALNFGAVPVFIDVKLPEYNLDESKLEAALSDKTKAVMAAHTLGNPFNLKVVRDFCKKHGLWLIEDNCDALGSRYYIDGEWKMTGAIGDIGTSSFYPPHHMTMGEGGAVYTADPELQRLLLSMRDWGRDCICKSGQDNRCGHRFDGQFGELPKGYDHKYVYSTFGYNLGITDMQSAVGCAQLKKFPSFAERRKQNWAFLRQQLEGAEDRLLLPAAEADSDPSWFGFCMTVAEGVDRTKAIRYIEDHGVQTRLLFAGNLTKHPCFDGIRNDGSSYRISGELTNTDIIMNRTFWVGVYPGMTEDRLAYMAKIIREAVSL